MSMLDAAWRGQDPRTPITDNFQRKECTEHRAQTEQLCTRQRPSAVADN